MTRQAEFSGSAAKGQAMLRRNGPQKGKKTKRALGIESLETRQLLTATLNEVVTSNGDDLSTRVRISTDSDFVSLPITPDWIELSNSSETPMDLSGYHLTDNKERPTRWEFPAGTSIPANGYLVVFASGENTQDTSLDETGRLHTSFVLASGDYLALTDTNGDVVDELDIPKMRRNVSYGFDTSNVGGYFIETTPGAANTTAQIDFVADTAFSHDRGLYDAPFDVAISTATEGATIVYTLDGSWPTIENNVVTNGTVYNSPISISSTTNLRAMAFKDGMGATNVDTQSYIFPAQVLQQSDSDIPPAANWGSSGPDWEMDPEVVNLPDGDPNKPTAADFATIPTVSITMNWDDLFGSQGIYLVGEHVEKPMSFEFFDPATGESVQQNASIEVQGGSSVSVPRNWKTDKISMLVRFKDPYGPTTLNANIFGEGSTTRFDQMTIDGQLNFVWDYGSNNTQRSQALYIHDQVAADVQNAISGEGSAPHGRFVNLFRNGIYWGMHYLHERPDESFAAEYWGGDKEEYHALNQNRTISQAINPDGSPTPNNGATMDIDAAVALARAAGNGGIAEWNAVNEQIDVEHFIEYLMMNWYLGNEDWGADNKNWYASRKNTPDGRWRFHSWDAEKVFQDFATGGVDEVGGGPKGLHKDLLGNEEYQILFADKIRELMFHDGILTTERLTPIFQARVDEVESPLRLESARWGDNRVNNPYVRQDVMDNFQSVYDNFFPPRHDRVLEDLIEEGVYPEISAPDFMINGANQHGGSISPGDTLSMMANAATVTTDTELIAKGAAVKAFVPSDNSLETGATPWYDTDFDDAAWANGSGNIGFGSDFSSRVDIDLDADFSANPTSVYARYEFQLPGEFRAADIDRMTMDIKFDDGYIVYLNGEEIARDNAPVNATFDSRAGDNESNFIHRVIDRFVTVDVSSGRSSLRPGKNVLAIQGLVAAGDDDHLLIGAALSMSDDVTLPAPVVYTLDGTDPREVGGSNVGITYENAFPLNGSTQVKARAFVEGQWSALTTATFTTPTAPGSVYVSEINYNPHQPSDGETLALPSVGNDDFEFIEVYNPSSTESVNLLGMQLSNGVAFDFPEFLLGPQSHAVIVENIDAFQLRYGTDIDIIGQWSGGLSNNGEAIELIDGSGTRLVEIGYDDRDPWFDRTDGLGATIELQPSGLASIAETGKYYHWSASSNVGGTPGSGTSQPIRVAITEVLASSNELAGEKDAIELFNYSFAPIDIGGWFLSDSSQDLFKFQIPDGTVLAAQSYIVFDEDDFASGANGFSLRSAGDDVWLVSRNDQGGVERFVDDIHFGPSANSESIGRVAAMGNPIESARIAPLQSSSLGAVNGPARVGPILISEVQYNAGPPSTEAIAAHADINSSDLEFVEVHNPTGASLDLTDWRIRGGIDIDFEAGTMLPAGEQIVVISFNPAKPENASRVAGFRAHYGIGNDVPLVGGFGGQLNNGGERIQLQRPGTPPADEPELMIRLYEDEVLYDDLSPWPTSADGSGFSLHRLTTSAYGNFGASWQGAVPSPGLVNFTSTPGDLNSDGAVDGDDVDLVCGAIGGPLMSQFDFDANGSNEYSDVETYLRDFIGTVPGDANLDGRVDVTDLNRVGTNWIQQGSHLTWSRGDFSCDDSVNAQDLSLLGVNWQFGVAAAVVARPPRAPLAAVAHETRQIDFAIRSMNHDDTRLSLDRSDHEPSIDDRQRRSRNVRERRMRASIESMARPASKHLDAAVSDNFFAEF